MNEREAFVANVIADPKNDFPRLQFADWLDERGDPLGEFIRTQIALAKYGDYRCPKQATVADIGVTGDGIEVCRCAWHGLERDQYELLVAYGTRWLADTYPGMRPCNPPSVHNGHPLQATEGMSWMFRRGFVARVRCQAQYWVKNHRDILARMPLEVVCLSDYWALGYLRRYRQPKKKSVNQTVAPVGRKWGFPGLPPVEPGWGRDITEEMLRAYWPGLEFIRPIGVDRFAGEGRGRPAASGTPGGGFGG